MSEVNKIYLLRGNDTPLSVCLRKREGDGDPVPYDLSVAERIRLALVGHGMHVFAKDTEVSGTDHNIVSGVIPGRSLLSGDYDLEVTFSLDGRDKRFAIEDMFEAVDFLAEDADGETEGEGAGIWVNVTVQPEVIEIAGPTGPKGDTPVLTADEDGTIYADGVLLTEVVKDVTEAVEVAERSRVTAESKRVAAESARVSAEQGRATAEAERASAEGARTAAEQGRVSAEQGRVSAESGRVSAESERVAAETAREAASATAVSNAETATSAANTAAEHAEEAATTIDDKIAGKADESEVSQLRSEVEGEFGESKSLAPADMTTILYVMSNGIWKAVTTNVGGRYYVVKQGQKVTITANSSRKCYWAFVTSLPSADGETISYVDGDYKTINAGETMTSEVPADCYMYVQYRTASQNANYWPSSIILSTKWVKVEQWDSMAEDVAKVSKYYSVSNNLLDPDTAVNNSRINATSHAPSSSADYWRSDYIDVSGLSKLYFGPYPPVAIAFYDSQKNYIADSYEGPFAKIPRTVPSGAKYILAHWTKSNLGVVGYRPVPYEDRMSAGIYEWRGYNNDSTFNEFSGSQIRYIPNWKVGMDDLLQFSSDASEREFTSDFGFIVPRGQFSGVANTIFTALAKYTNDVDDAVPTICFQLGYNSGRSGGFFNEASYKSVEYTIGAKDEFVRKSWRVPRMDIGVELIYCKIVIPANVTLTIADFGNYQESVSRPVNYTGGARFSAHGGYGFGVNFNTAQAVEGAAAVGAPTCIVVPKRTSDGVWVCFHDDASVADTLCFEDGSAVEALPVSSFTFAELQTMRYKDSSFRASYSGYQHILKLEDFFLICVKTGMTPMFSAHPFPSAAEWAEVKAMIDRFGLTSKLNIKMPVSGVVGGQFMTAYGVFGTEIESYGVDVSTSGSFVDAVSALDVDKTKVKLFIEYLEDVVTEEKVSAALAAGLGVGIASKGLNLTGEDLATWIKRGVTEFTYGTMTSYGLNW